MAITQCILTVEREVTSKIVMHEDASNNLEESFM